MLINDIKKDLFKKCVTSVVNISDDEINYIYDVYEMCSQSITTLAKEKIIDGVDFINHRDLIFYAIGEYTYSVVNLSEEKKEEFRQNDKIKQSMVNIITDKYLSLSRFFYHEKNLGNRYMPPMSSLNLYLNLMLNILQNYHKRDPRKTLITDLLIKSISIARAIVSLLIDGYETEAFASWRTLHECECTLLVLASHPKEVSDTYLKHMHYGFIFQKGHSDTPEEEATFNQMKEEMKGYGLKSKDIKKYIEYGWMYALEESKNDPDFKLNFRDGLERVAKLTSYSSRYELSSEIIHSTPLLIYSAKNYYYFLTLLSTYESFFRLEQVFSLLFSQNSDAEYKKQYENIKKVYFTQLKVIHKRESDAFKLYQKARLNQSKPKKEIKND